MAKYQFVITYECDVDESTGEILSTKILNKSEMTKNSSEKKISKKKDDGSTEPMLTLDSNKYILNSAAIKLLQVEADAKLDIKYETKGGVSYPIICVDDHTGNRLTKSNTVAFRGSKNEVLSKYGSEFTLQKEDDGTIVLKSDKVVEVPSGNNTVEIEDEDILDLDNFIDNADTTEIDSSLFKL